MNFRPRSVRGAVLALALATAASTGLVFTASANAADPVTPPWQSAANADPNEAGTLAFYDAAGNQVFGGSTTGPFATYAVASAANRAGDTKATLFAYTPVEGQAPGAWSTGTQLTAATAFPVGGAPAGISSTLPVSTVTAGDVALEDHLAAFPNASTTAGYQGVVELRLRTSKAGADPVSTATYAVADLVVDTTAHTWSVAFGTKTASTTTATVPTTASAGVGFNVPISVSATGTTPTGSVTLKDGSTVLGTKVLTSGAATIAVGASALSAGSHSLTATYAGSAGVAASTSTAYPVTVNKRTAAVATVVPTKATYGKAFTVSTTVTTSAGAKPTGNVSLLDGTKVLYTKALANGAASFSVAGTKLVPGTRSLTVKYAGSSSVATKTSAVKKIVVAKATSKTTNKLNVTTIKATKQAKLTIKVTATGVTGPTGTITVYDGSKVLKKITLAASKKGTYVYTLPKLKAGSHKIHAAYGGSSTVGKSTAASVTLKSTK